MGFCFSKCRRIYYSIWKFLDFDWYYNWLDYYRDIRHNGNIIAFGISFMLICIF